MSLIWAFCGSTGKAETRTRQILWDRVEWQRASAAEREAAAVWAAKRLGSTYRRVRAKTYSCGGESHWIVTFEHRKSGIELNLLPGGTYLMGLDSGRTFEKPVHRVTIPPFLVGVTEVTQGQWDRISGEDYRKWRGANLPIERVSWNAANDWLEKAGDGLRLPSESEWEYACRAGTQSKWCYGDDESKIGAYGWYEGNSDDQTHMVGTKKANAFGLHDMHGNVWEWCEDRYIDNYESGPNDHRSRGSGGSSRRVERGGSWDDTASSTRSSYRAKDGAGNCDSWVGFRVARVFD